MAKSEKPAAQSNKRAGVGGIVLAESDIELNAGRPTTVVKVRNTGDRPIQVGSHYHFFEANRFLEFDRPAAFGQRLDIPAGTAIRFEPGDEREVTLVPYAGKKFVKGFSNLVDGWAAYGDARGFYPSFIQAVKKAEEFGFKSTK